MAIEILRRGIPPQEVHYLADCSTCRSSLRFLRKDARYQADQRDGDYPVIECPVCSAQVTKAMPS